MYMHGHASVCPGPARARETCMLYAHAHMHVHRVCGRTHTMCLWCLRSRVCQCMPYAHLCEHCQSRFQVGILREEGTRAGINANRRLYSRRTCPLIPAELSFYSRRAGAAAPGGIFSCPACADGDGRDRRRQACGPGPARIYSALTEVGCCPLVAAACKLRGSPRPGPQQGT
jgi:hypothetical protein